MAVRDCFYRNERELKWVPGVTKSSLLIYLDFSRISGNNSNNGENFPPSAACCHFSREEIFCHLVQALLRAKTPIFTRCSTIICTICCCLDSSFFFGGCLSVCLPVLLSTAELSSCFHRILEIIITLTNANKTAMSHLYKLGAFEILLWKLLASDIVDRDKSRITKFLSQTHLVQVFLLQLAFCLILLLATVVPLGDFCFPETFMRNHLKI